MNRKAFPMLLFLSSCLSVPQTQTGTVASVSEGTSLTEETLEDEVPEAIEEDEFFTAEPEEREAFRILITRDEYRVVQVAYEEFLVRKEDLGGDEEQHRMFLLAHDKYDFNDWVFDGTLELRLNPHSGETEHVQYVPGQNPKTWQASVLFQEDVSRFQFDFPGNRVEVRDFLVRYQWRIQRREGMTDEEARIRAVEFLQSQLR